MKDTGEGNGGEGRAHGGAEDGQEGKKERSRWPTKDAQTRLLRRLIRKVSTELDVCKEGGDS